ncbi:MAG: cellulase family glycosylhydrolase [Acidimicrobiia bacterium]|nr:cellulase family glycosylhydrolase [Acidimicrobiia bacterium]
MSRTRNVGSGRTRVVGLVLLAVLVGAPLAIASALPGASAASPPVAPGVSPVEGQQFSGNWTQVNDPAATNGTAVMLGSDGASVATTTVDGSYTLNFRVKSSAARVALTLNGQQVGTAVLYTGAWQTVSVPVRVTGAPTWGVQQLPAVGYTPQPLYLDWMSLQVATPGYTTAGNKIIAPDGSQFVPRGVVRDGFQYQPTGPYYMSDNDFQAMYLWGSTVVRLPLDQMQWLSTSCNYDSTYASRLDAAVQSITSRGMVALLTLSRAAAGQACGTGQLVPMADDYSIPFWTQVANRYKNNPLVAFDLFNEPHDISEAVWHDGGMVGSPAWHAVGMQQLYNTVRGTGATNVLFISGTNWAFNIDVSLRRPIDGYGIVYGTHLYNPPESGPVRSDADGVVTPVAGRYPVAVTEFGTSSGTALYNQNVIAFAEQRGIGWMAFKWYSLPSTYALLNDFTTYTPSPAGAPVEAALLKARGWTTLGGLPAPVPTTVATATAKTAAAKAPVKAPVKK